jgi:Enzyme involved in the deoxyxylulose pathway of isoprenoid biosynthesis
MDTEKSVAQTLDLVGVGCEIVRITAPTVKDAANLEKIAAGLRAPIARSRWSRTFISSPKPLWRRRNGSRKYASIPAITRIRSDLR